MVSLIFCKVYTQKNCVTLNFHPKQFFDKSQIFNKFRVDTQIQKLIMQHISFLYSSIETTITSTEGFLLLSLNFTIEIGYVNFEIAHPISCIRFWTRFRPIFRWLTHYKNRNLLSITEQQWRKSKITCKFKISQYTPATTTS